MAIRKQRTLDELYNVTPTLSQPKITPVLKGRYRMQGPIDEQDYEIQTNMVPSQIRRDSTTSSEIQNIDVRLSSGTCNVCSAPCSSCLHDQALMGSKTDETFGEIFAENVSSNSVNAARAAYNSRQYEGQHQMKTSNAASISSSHDPSSDISECKISSRALEASTAFEDIVMPRDYGDDGHVDTGSMEAVGLATNSPILLDTSLDRSGHMPSSSPKNSVPGDTLGDGSISVVKDEDVAKVTESHILADKNESDDSDFVEQDVKVCDICGDAGRDELLAVCCRCSDGAEHTYCMREMLAKVPEGYWLCEECKFDEELNSQRQGKIGRVDVNDKICVSGEASTEDANLLVESETKIPDIDGDMVSNELVDVKVLGKRQREDAEVSSAAKKPSLEPNIVSPKIQSPIRVSALSRESSFKNLDKGKMKPAHQLATAPRPNNDSSESVLPLDRGLKLQTPRGTFLKSNSFSAVSANPKVKLVDEVVPLKQKSAREPSFLDKMDGGLRSMGKSMSFKSTSSGRFSTFESKVKLLSPRSSNQQDTKGFNKHTRERSSFERKSSSKLDPHFNRPKAGTLSVTPSRADPKLVSRGEPSPLYPMSAKRETKAMQSDYKSISLLKSSSLAARRGSEVSVTTGEIKRQHFPSGGGFSSSSVVSSSQEKLGQASTNEAFSSSTSCVADTPNCNPSGRSQDGLPNMKDSSFIENEFHVENTASKNFMANSCKASTMNKFRGFPVETPLSRTGDATPALPSDGKSFLRDMPDHFPSAIFFSLKTVAVPEHEYIWKGGFEIQKCGKLAELCDGVQAHVSTCVSPKVLEAVSKFPDKVVLKEVARSSVWPVQFQTFGVREDNIALFFFAKDFESYRKSYKILLEDMMRNDVALKGNLDGVELLIFPSNQLPENSQRWNMLFFLWGVFRGRRPYYPSHISGTADQSGNSRYIPQAIKSLPEDISSSKLRDKTQSACGDLPAAPDASDAQPSFLSSRTINGNCDSKASPSDRMNGCKQLALEKGSKLTSKSSSTEETIGGKLCQQVPYAVGPVDGGLDPGCKSGAEHQHCFSIREVGSGGPDSIEIWDSPANKGQPLHTINTSGGLNKATAGSFHVESMSDEINNDENKINSTTHGAARVASGSPRLQVGQDDTFNQVPIPERYFFPVDPLPVKDIALVDKLTPWKISALDEAKVHDRFPCLELALGGETKPSSQDTPSLSVGVLDKKNSHEHHLDEGTSKDEDDVSASLSLSLSFPFPDEQSYRSSENEQVMSERRHVNNSLLLFGDFRDK